MQGRVAKGIRARAKVVEEESPLSPSTDTFDSSAPAEHLINRAVINDASSFRMSPPTFLRIFFFFLKSALAQKSSLIT